MTTLVSLAAAMAVGLLFTRIVKLVHLPNVTGYLVAGVLIGPYCLKLIDQGHLGDFSVITTIALGFIAFSIGGEFKLSHIKQIGGKAITITFFESLLAVALVDTALLAFGVPAPMAVTLGAIAAATAPAATLMVVRQYKARGPVTSTLLPVVAFDDAICLMAYSISIALAKTMVNHTSITVTTVLLKPLGEILLSLLVGAALGFALSLCMRFFASRANRLCLMITAVVAGVGLSEWLGLSSLLTCMMVGALFANLRNDVDRILEGMDRWTPPVFLLFFVISGAQLNIYALPSIGLVGVLYLVFRSAGKYFGARVGATLMKSPPTVQKYLGLCLLPQAGVAVGVAQMAMTELPQYGATIQTVVLCATLVYELVGPVITKLALTGAKEIGAAASTSAQQPGAAG